MFKSVTKFGAAIALLVSAEAFAAGAAVRLAEPVVKAPVQAVKPGQVTKPGSLAEAAKAATNDNSANASQSSGQECSLELATQKAVAGTKLNPTLVSTELANGGVTVVGCQAGAEGVLNMQPVAKEVAFTASNLNTTVGLAGPAALARAKKEVAGIDTTPEAEVGSFDKLASGDCKVFNAAKFQKFAK